MHRCFIRPENISGNQVVLDAEESHHLLRVLRVKLDEPVIGFDGKGTEYQLTITSLKPRALEAKITSTRVSEAESPVTLILAQALVKGDKMEFILQKAVELGVSEIVPLITQHVAFHLDPGKYAAKQERWRATILEACKQCGRAILPQVKEIIPFSEWLTYLADKPAMNLLCYEKAGRSIRSLLQAEPA